MDSLIAGYLKERKNCIAKVYTWKFDTEIPKKKFSISIKGDSWLEKTNELKSCLKERIQVKPQTQSELEAIAEYFIKDWGGIKRFSKPREVVEMFRDIAETDAKS